MDPYENWNQSNVICAHCAENLERFYQARKRLLEAKTAIESLFESMGEAPQKNDETVKPTAIVTHKARIQLSPIAEEQEVEKAAPNVSKWNYF